MRKSEQQAKEYCEKFPPPPMVVENADNLTQWMKGFQPSLDDDDVVPMLKLAVYNSEFIKAHMDKHKGHGHDEDEELLGFIVGLYAASLLFIESRPPEQRERAKKFTYDDHGPKNLGAFDAWRR